MKKILGQWVLVYLRFFSRLNFKKYSPDVVGITGSAGKTTAMSAVAAVLKDKYRLKISYKANSESGIPLDMLGIKPVDYSIFDWLRMIVLVPVNLLIDWHPVEKYVVEMGIDSSHSPKNMEYLLSIIRPRTGIFLNALPVHMQNFESVEEIAQEKGKLIVSLPDKTGLAIVNADDQLVMKQALLTKAQVMTFGKSDKSDVQISKYMPDLSGTVFGFKNRGDAAELKLPYLLAEHFGYSFAAALCVCVDEGIDIVKGCELLKKNFVLPPGRMSVFKGINESIMVDSSYNASAGPTIDAIRLIKSLKANKRLALLGDLRELGKVAAKEHEKVMEEAMRVMDGIYLVGPLMKQFGMPYLTDFKGEVRWFENAYKAGEYLKPKLTPGDILLVKGSQNTILLETAVEMLLENPLIDKKLLCRRDSYWEKRREIVKK